MITGRRLVDKCLHPSHQTNIHRPLRSPNPFPTAAKPKGKHTSPTSTGHISRSQNFTHDRRSRPAAAHCMPCHTIDLASLSQSRWRCRGRERGLCCSAAYRSGDGEQSQVHRMQRPSARAWGTVRGLPAIVPTMRIVDFCGAARIGFFWRE